MPRILRAIGNQLAPNMIDTQNEHDMKRSMIKAARRGGGVVFVNANGVPILPNAAVPVGAAGVTYATGVPQQTVYPAQVPQQSASAGLSAQWPPQAAGTSAEGTYAQPPPPYSISESYASVTKGAQ